MKVFVALAVLILGLYAAQTSLLTYLDYNGVSANLMLAVVVSTAFLRGLYIAVAMGLCVGLLQDLTTGDFFGCTTFTYMTIGLIFGKISERFVKDQFIVPVLAAPVSAAIYFFMMMLFILILGYPINVAAAIEKILIPLIFYQIIFALPIHKIAYDFDKLVTRFFS